MSKLLYSTRKNTGVICVEGPALLQQRIFCFCSQFPSSWDFTASGCRRCSWLWDVLDQEFLPAPGLLMKSEIEARPQFPDTYRNHVHCSKAYPAFPPLQRGLQPGWERSNLQTPDPGRCGARTRPAGGQGLTPSLEELPKSGATNSFNNSGACSETSTLRFVLLFIVTCKINSTLNWRLLNCFSLPAKGPRSPLGCDHAECSMKKLDCASFHPYLQPLSI